MGFLFNSAPLMIKIQPSFNCAYIYDDQGNMLGNFAVILLTVDDSGGMADCQIMGDYPEILDIKRTKVAFGDWENELLTSKFDVDSYEVFPFTGKLNIGCSGNIQVECRELVAKAAKEQIWKI